jgi:hypothetical protein
LNGQIQSLINSLQNIETWLDKNISLDGLIAVPALFVALLVPIAFFLMERQDQFAFDRNVILSKIILVRVSIPLILLVSVSLLFNISTLSVVLSFLLMVVVILVLIRVYKWMVSIEVLKYKTTYKQKMRLKFIRTIKNDTEKVDIWAIILNDEELKEKNQRGLVSEFLTTVKSLEDGKNRYPKSNLLSLMSSNVKKIDFSDINSYEDLVTYAIEYFQQTRDARTKNKIVDDKKKRVAYPSHYQRELALNLLKIALGKKINDVFAYLYFSAIKKHLEKKDVSESDFIRDFLPSYINLIKENEGYNAKELWHELSEWIVTKELLSNEGSGPKSIALINAYMESIGRDARVDTELSRHEISVIDDVTGYMFPNVNVSFWFDIMTFYNSGWGLDEGEDSTHGQVRSHVSRRRDFGLFNALGGLRDWIDDEKVRMKVYEDEANKQDEETIFILGLIYPWLRNPNEIQKVIEQIYIIEREDLFETDSYESRRLESLKIRFEKIKTYTDKQIAEQKKKKRGK